MVMNVEERIAKIKEKKQILDARLNALEQKAKSESRKRETRQKIIVGGAVIAHMEKNPSFAAAIRALLAASVGRPNDKEAIAELLAAAPAEVKPPVPAVTPHPPARTATPLPALGGGRPANSARSNGNAFWYA